MERITGNEAGVDIPNRRVTARSAVGVEAVGELASALSAEEIEVEDLGLHQPSLDDVFLTLTGTPAEPVPSNDIEEPVR